MRSQNSKRRGQSLVEATLILLVFVSIFVGIIDLGQVLFIHQTLVERTRNAARYGAVRPYDALAMENMVLYASPTPPPMPGNSEYAEGEVNHRPDGIFGLTPAMVDVQRFGVGSNDDRVVITVSNYPFTFFSPLIARVVTGKPIMASLPYEGS